MALRVIQKALVYDVSQSPACFFNIYDFFFNQQIYLSHLLNRFQPANSTAATIHKPTDRATPTKRADPTLDPS